MKTGMLETVLIEEAGPQDTGDGEPSEEYIAQFLKAVDLYQEKDHRCFQYGSTNHLIYECLKDSDSTADVPLNSKEETAMKGA